MSGKLKYIDTHKKFVVYSIVNTMNGKLYIGSSSHYNQRRNWYLSHLRKGDHHSVLLQRSYNKYGEESIEFNVLEICDNVSDMVFYEQKWIDLTYCYLPRFGFNILRFAFEGRHGMPISESHRQKMVESQTKVMSDGEHRKRIGDKIREFQLRPENRKANSDRYHARKRPKQSNDKLTAQDIFEIKRLYFFENRSQGYIKIKFNIDQGYVSRIINGKSHWENKFGLLL